VSPDLSEGLWWRPLLEHLRGCAEAFPGLPVKCHPQWPWPPSAAPRAPAGTVTGSSCTQVSKGTGTQGRPHPGGRKEPLPPFLGGGGDPGALDTVSLKATQPVSSLLSRQRPRRVSPHCWPLDSGALGRRDPGELSPLSPSQALPALLPRAPVGCIGARFTLRLSFEFRVLGLCASVPVLAPQCPHSLCSWPC
jgi:hypothetical protein